MAFQSALLPNIAAATADLWPSIANTLVIPWRGSTVPQSKGPSQPTQNRGSQSTSAPHQTANARGLQLPDFLLDAVVDLEAISAAPGLTPHNIRSSIANMPPFALAAAANPLVQRAAFRLAAQQPSAPFRRLFSSASSMAARQGVASLQGGRDLRASSILLGQSLRWSPPRTHSVLAQPIGMLQRRTLTNGGISRNMLANLEAAANRNPTSATAQNAFYQVLLKANMPAIIIERYQSGRFAKNHSVDEAYAKALLLLTGTSPNEQVAGINGNHASGLSPTQLQAVSQAVAAKARGSNVAIATGPQDTGSRDSPIHVVVDESTGSIVFKWIKFIVLFSLITYLSLVVVTMLVEGFNTFRRTGNARVDSEVKAENQRARFSDVHGCDEAKEELQELVEFLKNPERFSTLGGKLPKGVLLVGPPGTGKTLLARAVAGEAGVPFFYMSGSEFDEVYVGVGAKRVRDLFNAARAKSPSIVFIDELDAIGGKRNSRDAAYVKQTLNQLLTELDGFEQNSGVIVIGATNFPKLLDKALTRPGRFDRHVVVDLPDVRGRLAILKHHSRKIKLGQGVNLQAIAQSTSGLSGAELENIVNSAAIHASKSKNTFVTTSDFDWAKDKIIMGSEKKSLHLSPKEKEMTAYHEAGHALVTYFSKTKSDTLYKVTILPRGQSLGHTAILPEMDKYSYSAADFLASIESCMGGKVAEEMVYGKDMVTSGVSTDLDMATSTAFNMIASYGMSQKLGPMEFYRRYEYLSTGTREQVEAEVQRVLSESYQRALELLTEKRKELDYLAEALLDYETLDRSEVEKVIRGEKLPGRTPMPRTGMSVPKLPNPLEGPLRPLGAGDKSDDGPSNASPPPATPGGGLVAE